MNEFFRYRESPIRSLQGMSGVLVQFESMSRSGREGMIQVIFMYGAGRHLCRPAPYEYEYIVHACWFLGNSISDIDVISLVKQYLLLHSAPSLYA